jgi:3-oxoacyl-[acyl-carrier-protein] synthase-3
MQTIRAKIAGVGRYLPDCVVTNAELEQRFGLKEGWIKRRNGVLQRRRADLSKGETPSYMGAQASREALKNAGLAPDQLDLIINASGTPEQAIPDGGPLLQRRLGLGDSGIAAMSVHTTCLSFLAALDVAASFIATGRYQNILICSSEMGSVSVYGKDPKSESLWGDAAAAVVLTVTPTGEASAVEALTFQTFGDGADLTACRGSGALHHPRYPDTTAEHSRFIMKGPEVLQMALDKGPDFFKAFYPPALRKDFSAIDLIIPHQPSRAGILGMVHFGMPREKIVET